VAPDPKHGATHHEAQALRAVLLAAVLSVLALFSLISWLAATNDESIHVNVVNFVLVLVLANLLLKGRGVAVVTVACGIAYDQSLMATGPQSKEIFMEAVVQFLPPFILIALFLRMTTRKVVPVWALAGSLLACAQGAGDVTPASAAELPGGAGALTGTVTLGPTVPAERPGVPSSVAASGVRIVISRLDGRELQSVVSDAGGIYRAVLPPGSYQLTIPQLPRPQYTKDLPATVTITAGQEARMDIRINTGILAR
jgi:hypothetical protein